MKIIVWKISLSSNKSCCWSFRYVSSLGKKIFFRAPMKCFSLYGSNYSDSHPFKNVAFGDIQDHSLKKAHFKKKNCCWSFNYVFTFRKKVFSRVPVKCFSVFGSNNSDSFVFEYAAFGEAKDHSLVATLFRKNIFDGSFRYVSILRKKVFSGAPMKCFSLYDSNESDSLVFGNAAFGDIKDESEAFSKRKLLWKFWDYVYLT